MSFKLHSFLSFNLNLDICISPLLDKQDEKFFNDYWDTYKRILFKISFQKPQGKIHLVVIH